MPIREAAMLGARMRFRAVVMTSIAFLLGILPLVTANGAAMLSRRGVGTSVFAGMIFATTFGIFLIPMLYTSFQSMRRAHQGAVRPPRRPRPARAGGNAVRRPSGRARARTGRRMIAMAGAPGAPWPFGGMPYPQPQPPSVHPERTLPMTKFGIAQSVRRVEDPRLLEEGQRFLHRRHHPARHRSRRRAAQPPRGGKDCQHRRHCGQGAARRARASTPVPIWTRTASAGCRARSP